MKRSHSPRLRPAQARPKLASKLAPKLAPEIPPGIPEIRWTDAAPDEVTPLVDEAAPPADLVEPAALSPDVEPLADEDEDVDALADEAAIEAEAEVEAPPGDDDQLSVLGQYLRDMADLPLLRPEEEFDRARTLEALEVAVWEAMLSCPALVTRVIDAAEGALGRSFPEAVAFRRVATAVGDRKPGRAYTEALGRAARQLRDNDNDRVGVHAALALWRNIAATRKAHAGVPAGTIGRVGRQIAEVQRQAQRAKDEFVSANLRLVIALARRYRYGAMAFGDLIQEGNIGLMKAVERFDFRRGYRFSTYASWWIRHAIQRALTDRGHVIRLPVHLVDSQQRLARARREMQTRLGREPTPEELAASTGIAASKIERLGRMSPNRTAVSLDKKMGEDDDRRLIDTVSDPNTDERPVPDALAHEALVREVRALLCHLKPVEADILRQRFGIDDDDEREKTLSEIGEKYNLSRERIRQIQEQALGKLRSALQRRGHA